MPRCRDNIVLSLPAPFICGIGGLLYLDQLRVELDRLGGVGDGISVCLGLDICLEDRIATQLDIYELCW
jgi:hypothetical protein